MSQCNNGLCTKARTTTRYSSRRSGNLHSKNTEARTRDNRKRNFYMTLVQSLQQIWVSLKQILLSTQNLSFFLLFFLVLMVARYVVAYKPTDPFKDSILSLLNNLTQTIYLTSLIAGLSFWVNPGTFDIKIVYMLFAALLLLLAFLSTTLYLLLSHIHLFAAAYPESPTRVERRSAKPLEKVENSLDGRKPPEAEQLESEEREEVLEIFQPSLKSKRVDTAIYSTTPISIDACPKYIASLVAATNTFFQGFAVPAQAVGVRLSTSFVYITIALGKGVRLESIVKYQSDIARDLKESCVNFEVHEGDVILKIKREDRVTVEAGHVLNGNKCKAMDIILGLDRNNNYYTFNLTNMPHMLISGTTGSGKSVAIHSIIVSLLTSTPANLLRFMLLDPKQIEFAIYQALPNLIAPVITCEDKALEYVEWLVQEMTRRYSMLSENGARNIAEYNNSAPLKERLPYIVLIVDELGDLMLGPHAKAFEPSLIKLAQKSRAAGIHMILSTQRPSASIFTGLLKSNVPTRLACKVASKMESRIILDQAGAENLLGQGDMLFYVPGMDEPVRIQSPYITNDLIKHTVDYCNEHLIKKRRKAIS